jgi:hypothetical protein
MLQHLLAAFVAIVISASGALAHEANAVATSIADLVSPAATSLSYAHATHQSQAAAPAVSATSPIASVESATSIIDAALTATSTDANSNSSSNNQKSTTQHLSHLSSPQSYPPTAEQSAVANSTAANTSSPSFSPSAQTGRVLGAATSALDTVTHSELDAALNALRSQVFSFTSLSGSSAPLSVAAFAPSQQIDQLTNTTITGGTITNATVSGLSGLSASDIPALNYFPASSTISIGYGGTGTSTAPTSNKLLFSDANGSWEYVATSSLGLAGSGSGTVGSGTQGQFAFYNAVGTTLTATSSLFLAQLI